MLLLAHVGYTLLGMVLLQRPALKGRLNPWALALASILPDVVDRALYAFVLPGARSGRLIAHTLAFNLALLTVLRALRSDLWPYGAASVLHVLMDAGCLPSRHMLWPVLGANLGHVNIASLPRRGESSSADLAGRLARVPDPYRSAGREAIVHEMGGLVALAVFLMARRSRQGAGGALQGGGSEHET